MQGFQLNALVIFWAVTLGVVVGAMIMEPEKTLLLMGWVCLVALSAVAIEFCINKASSSSRG
jgi:hypothetical protein